MSHQENPRRAGAGLESQPGATAAPDSPTRVRWTGFDEYSRRRKQSAEPLLEDLTPDLAKLLIFASQVGTAVRKYSAAMQGNAWIKAPIAELDLMWLADCLEKLLLLGHAIQEQDRVLLLENCQEVEQAFQRHLTDNSRGSADTFARHKDRLDLNQAIAIVAEIRRKATPFEFQHRHAVALHESAHAVFAVLLRRPLIKVSIIPDAGGAGAVDREQWEDTPQHIFEEIVIALAGELAPDLYGSWITNADHDAERIAALIEKCPELRTIDSTKLKRALGEQLQNELRPALQALTRELFVRRCLCGEFATQIIVAALPDPETQVRFGALIDRLAAEGIV